MGDDGVVRRRVRWLPVPLTAAMFLVMYQAGEATAAAVLNVPGDFATIQAAVDAAAPGDTVLVSPGTYVGQVDFHAKAITLRSIDGPASTVIESPLAAPTVTIDANLGETPVLRGFTIRGGTLIAVETSGGPALIVDNHVTGNQRCSGAITAFTSAATILGNVISDNQPSCGGVAVIGPNDIRILNNTITDNAGETVGGIALSGLGTATVSGNVISNNASFRSSGGIFVRNGSGGSITNNVIVGNTGGVDAGGIDVLVGSGDPSPTITNNTVAGNSGSAILVDGVDAVVRVTNNVVVGSGAAPAFACGVVPGPDVPMILHNDVVNDGSAPAYGGCADQTGVNGNVSADPLFVTAAGGDYHLRRGSPAIDAALESAAPAVDVDGDPRPFDGDGDGVAVSDIGADEFTGDRTPPTIACAATPGHLTPAAHQLRQVAVGVTADDESGPVTVALVSVTSNQPDSGLGPTDIPGDIQQWTPGTDDRTGLLRAEHFGAARVYTLTYRAADAAGNTTTCTATVTVPLAQPGRTSGVRTAGWVSPVA